MASYALTTTAVQESAITAKRLAENAAGATYADNAAYLAVQHANMLRPLVTDYIEARLHLVADSYRAGTASQRAAVDSALGIA